MGYSVSIPTLICSIWLLLAHLTTSHPPYITHNPPSITHDTIPAVPANGSSVAQYTSSAHGLDAPKVRPINATSYDWWYFDVVSMDQAHSMAIAFLAAPPAGFAPAYATDNDILLVSLQLGHPTLSGSIILPAESASVVSVGNGASGEWEGSGACFEGTPDMSEYVVEVDAPGMGVRGRMTLRSLAPAHYPCGPAVAGETMVIMPGVGWANAVPDAVGEVEFNINGTVTKFTGAGYHDKNWGDSPFVDNVASWVWGHGRLGPYSIVWYDALNPAGAESASGYVARDGRIISASCSGVTVRPTGANSTYPPVVGSPPAAFHIQMDLGPEGTLEVDATSAYLVEDLGVGEYFRWTGELTGGIKGQQGFTGPALWESFVLLPWA